MAFRVSKVFGSFEKRTPVMRFNSHMASLKIGSSEQKKHWQKHRPVERTLLQGILIFPSAFVELQVIYGKTMSDEFDRQGLSAMVDYWISPAAVKREFEATKSKYFRFPQISTALLLNFS